MTSSTILKSLYKGLSQMLSWDYMADSGRAERRGWQMFIYDIIVAKLNTFQIQFCAFQTIQMLGHSDTFRSDSEHAEKYTYDVTEPRNQKPVYKRFVLPKH
jgi:hypothetical protein